MCLKDKNELDLTADDMPMVVLFLMFTISCLKQHTRSEHAQNGCSQMLKTQTKPFHECETRSFGDYAPKV